MQYPVKKEFGKNFDDFKVVQDQLSLLYTFMEENSYFPIDTAALLISDINSDIPSEISMDVENDIGMDVRMTTSQHFQSSKRTCSADLAFSSEGYLIIARPENQRF